MCLSTAYINEKSDDRIAARYVSSIDIDGDTITLT
ncbi:MAG: CooT family nickel-binding protein, partial [Firmicutes bacterium]|nr:CooT family nickel-binding protein [Bacillota bacterium]